MNILFDWDDDLFLEKVTYGGCLVNHFASFCKNRGDRLFIVYKDDVFNPKAIDFDDLWYFETNKPFFAFNCKVFFEIVLYLTRMLEKKIIILFFKKKPYKAFLINKLIKKYNINAYIKMGYELKHFRYVSQIHINKKILVLFDPLSIKQHNINMQNEELNNIESSHSYYVPFNFYNQYVRVFNSPKIKPFYFPILEYPNIPAKKNRTNNNIRKEKTVLGYFGNIYLQRIAESAIEWFNMKRDIDFRIFSNSENYCVDNASYFKAVPDYMLMEEMKKCDFLVVFDNLKREGCSDYLPSKVLQYISAKKRIIVFGDDEKSACCDILKKYGSWFFCNINNPKSFKDLDKYISHTDDRTSELSFLDSSYDMFKEKTVFEDLLNEIKM